MRVVGYENVVKNLNKLKGTVIYRVIGAVDMSLADLVNHAKQGHADATAHMNSRYRNQTTNLTNSIQSRIHKITDSEVVGVAWAGQFYGYYVEFGSFNVKTGRMNQPYPFMYPALQHAKVKLRERMEKLSRKGR